MKIANMDFQATKVIFDRTEKGCVGTILRSEIAKKLKKGTGVAYAWKHAEDCWSYQEETTHHGEFGVTREADGSAWVGCVFFAQEDVAKIAKWAKGSKKKIKKVSKK